jgi:hypothetical protein
MIKSAGKNIIVQLASGVNCLSEAYAVQLQTHQSWRLGCCSAATVKSTLFSDRLTVNWHWLLIGLL